MDFAGCDVPPAEVDVGCSKNTKSHTSDALSSLDGIFNSLIGDLALKEPFVDRLKAQAACSDAVQGIITAEVAKVMTARASALSKKKKHVVHDKLSAREMQSLTETFPFFNIVPAAKLRSGGHPFLRAFRKLWERNIVENIIGLDPGSKVTKPSEGKHVTIKAVGPYPNFYVSNRYLSSHLCCPLLGLQDHKRRAMACASLSNHDCEDDWSTMQKKKIIDSLMNRKENNVCCRRKAQYCRVKADHVVFCHSTYDMTPETIGEIMDSADASFGYASVLFDPIILIQKQGKFSDVDISFERNGDYITFYFPGEYDHGYTHKIETYLNMFKSNVIRTPKNNYSVHIESGANGHLDIRFVKICEEYVPPTSDIQKLPLFKNDKTLISTWFYNTTCQKLLGMSALEKKMICVPTKLWRKVLGYAFVLRDGKFELKSLYTAAHAMNTRAIIEASVASELADEDRVAEDDLLVMVVTAYMIVFIRYYEAVKTLQILKEDEDRVRSESNSSILTNVVKRLLSSRTYNAFVKEDRFPLEIKNPSPAPFNCTNMYVDVDKGLVIADQRVKDYAIRKFFRNLVTTSRKYQIEVADAPTVWTLQEYVQAVLNDKAPILDIHKNVESPSLELMHDKSKKIVGEALKTIHAVADDQVSVSSVKSTVSVYSDAVSINSMIISTRRTADCCDCPEEFVVVDNTSNGDCMFQALSDSGVGFTARELRSMAANSTMNIDRKYMDKDGPYTPEMWGNTNDLAAIAYELNIKICVHDRLVNRSVSSAAVRYGPQDVSDVHHLLHTNEPHMHFAALVPKLITIPKANQNVTSMRNVDDKTGVVCIQQSLSSSHKDVMNRKDYSKICNVIDPMQHSNGYSTKAPMRVAELLESYESEVLKMKENHRALDLACDKAGVTTLLCQHTKVGHVVMVPIRSNNQIPLIPAKYASRITVYGAEDKAFVDIESSESRDKLVSVLKEDHKKFDFISCDAYKEPGMPDEVDPDTCAEMIDSLIDIAHEVSYDNTEFVIRLRNPTHPTTIKQVKKLLDCYHIVFVAKPRTSRQTSDEFYVVAYFRRDKTGVGKSEMVSKEYETFAADMFKLRSEAIADVVVAMNTNNTKTPQRDTNSERFFMKYRSEEVFGGMNLVPRNIQRRFSDAADSVRRIREEFRNRSRSETELQSFSNPTHTDMIQSNEEVLVETTNDLIVFGDDGEVVSYNVPAENVETPILEATPSESPESSSADSELESMTTEVDSLDRLQELLENETAPRSHSAPPLSVPLTVERRMTREQLLFPHDREAAQWTFDEHELSQPAFTRLRRNQSGLVRAVNRLVGAKRMNTPRISGLHQLRGGVPIPRTALDRIVEEDFSSDDESTLSLDLGCITMSDDVAQTVVNMVQDVSERLSGVPVAQDGMLKRKLRKKKRGALRRGWGRLRSVMDRVLPITSVLSNQDNLPVHHKDESDGVFVPTETDDFLDAVHSRDRLKDKGELMDAALDVLEKVANADAVTLPTKLADVAKAEKFVDKTEDDWKKMCRAAIVELRWYHELTHKIACSNAALELRNLDTRGYKPYTSLEKGYEVFRKSDLTGDPQRDPEFVFSPEGFVPVTELKDTTLAVTSSYSKVPTSWRILQSELIDTTSATYYAKPDNFYFVNSVFGSGKTHDIIQEFSKDAGKSLIVAPTAEARDMIRSRIVDKGIAVDVNKHVRTCDSILINGIGDFPNIYFDEALMYHPGAILSIAELTNAKKVMMYGDVAQIGFINRLPKFDSKFKFKSIMQLVKVNKTVDVTRRTPVDVAAALNGVYKEIAKASGSTCNLRSMKSVLRSMSLKKIVSKCEVPKDKEYQYLTFTQPEKTDMINGGYVNTKTVHEYQGCEADDVCVVRLKFKDEILFESMAHIVVALTRHRKSFLYATASRNADKDPLQKIASREFTDVELRQYQVLTGGMYAMSETSHAHQYSRVEFTDRNTRYRVKVGFGTGSGIRCGKSAAGRKYILIGKESVQKIDGLRSAVRRMSELCPTSSYLLINLDGLDHERIPKVVSEVHAATRNRQIHVHYECSTRLNIVSHEVQDLLIRNGIIDYQTPVPVELTHDEPHADYEPVTVVAETGGLSDVQCMLHEMYGQGNYINMRADSYMFHHFDQETIIDGFSVVPTKGIFREARFDKMRPTLCGPVPALKMTTQRETQVSTQKRNLGIINMMDLVDIEELSQELHDGFLKTYFIEGFERVLREEIQPDAASMTDWLNKQPTGTARRIDEDVAIFDQDMTRYSLDIKRKTKVDQTAKSMTEYAAAQTIVYPSKQANAIYCSMLARMRKCLKACLKPQFFIYTDVTPEEFAARIQRRMPIDEFFKGEAWELDISKYDKSQGEAALLFELKLFKTLGMPQIFLDIWRTAHVSTTASSAGTGFSVKLSYQRKSGDAGTFIGNTLFLMACVAHHFDMDHCKLAMFAGDDSLLIGDQLKCDPQMWPRYYNLEAKLYRYTSRYFCSKIFVRSGDVLKFVPDPMKTALRLCRRDIVNQTHIDDYMMSLRDLTENYNDYNVCIELCGVIQERLRKVPSNMTVAISAMYHICRSRDEELYYTVDGDVIDESQRSIHSDR